MKKLAVLFPGIGYTADRSLLYFSRRLAEELGYETLTIAYNGLPKKAKGDPEKLRVCFEKARVQAGKQLKERGLDGYDEIVFIGKSIGTAAAAALAEESPQRGRIRFVLYTPVAETFGFPLGEAVVFTGGEDSWVGGKESPIPRCCANRGIPCRVIPGANHSLETGRVEEDLRNLNLVMEETGCFLHGDGEGADP